MLDWIEVGYGLMRDLVVFCMFVAGRFGVRVLIVCLFVCFCCSCLGVCCLDGLFLGLVFLFVLWELAFLVLGAGFITGR